MVVCCCVGCTYGVGRVVHIWGDTMMMWYGLSCFVAGLGIGVWAHHYLARDPYPEPIRYYAEELYDDEGRKYYESGYDVRDAGEWV